LLRDDREPGRLNERDKLPSVLRSVVATCRTMAWRDNTWSRFALDRPDTSSAPSASLPSSVTRDDVQDLVNGTRKVMKTVF
jgi:lysophospholipid acyltransferase (LPLAT)-like uncharacterized protein